MAVLYTAGCTSVWVGVGYLVSGTLMMPVTTETEPKAVGQFNAYAAIFPQCDFVTFQAGTPTLTL